MYYHIWQVSVLALGGALVGAGVLPRESLTTFVLYVEFIGGASGDVADQWGPGPRTVHPPHRAPSPSGHRWYPVHRVWNRYS